MSSENMPSGTFLKVKDIIVKKKKKDCCKMFNKIHYKIFIKSSSALKKRTEKRCINEVDER